MVEMGQLLEQVPFMEMEMMLIQHTRYLLHKQVYLLQVIQVLLPELKTTLHQALKMRLEVEQLLQPYLEMEKPQQKQQILFKKKKP